MTTARRSPPRHELAEVDAAALEAARAGDAMVAAAGAAGNDRWLRYLESLPARLRDDPLPDLRSAARLARAAYGPKDSVRDALPADATEPFLDRIDRLIKAINRWEANRG
jgi:hypothetical protein